ncbi:GTPase [Thermopolyspora sp. NPDC052614]|uniref:GTPase family protein n=1 Tax=Thermopolyspora sp. NPDC052614 TaxID=3155682 RepID=UPI003427D382
MTLLRQRAALSLDERLAALDEAAELAYGRLDPGVVAAAREVVTRAGARRGLSLDHTVVALAGATGSGKSSLFNALAGDEVAAVGVTRPTTDKAQAALWDPEGAAPLLDWLRVPRRHVVAASSPDGTAVSGAEQGPSGLILLDLPDHDSIEASHRLEVNRLVGLVDLLVWVLDPQKYADAAVHERYLRPLARHQDVTVVVLNQIDRLPASAIDPCVSDLRRRLAEDGLDGVRLVAASARTGAGLPDLRWMLAASVSRRRAWADRLAADAAMTAGALACESGPPEAGATLTRGAPDREPGPRSQDATPPAQWWQLAAAEDRRGPRRKDRRGLRPNRAPAVDALAAPLTSALSEAAGVPLVVEAVAKAHRYRSVVATGWPITRWLRRLRPDPLRRLRLTTGPGDPRLASSAPYIGLGTPPHDVHAPGDSGQTRATRSGNAVDSGGEDRPRGGLAPTGGGAGDVSGAEGVPQSRREMWVGARSAPGRDVERSSTAGRPGTSKHPAGLRPGSGHVVDRTSLPGASAVQRSRVETAIRDVAQEASQGLPVPWAAAVRRAAVSRMAEIPDALDRAVATTWGDARAPRWWRVVGAWQWLLLAVAAAGLLWLLALVGLDYLRLPEPPVPTLGELPWPTVLFLGGVLAGLLTASLTRLAAWAGGRRRARRTARRLQTSMDRVGRDLILAPVAAELDRHRRFTQCVDISRAG